MTQRKFKLENFVTNWLSSVWGWEYFPHNCYDDKQVFGVG